LTELLPRAEVVHGPVIRVDRRARTVLVRPGDGEPDRIVGYDHLVVGAGAREPLDEIPGTAEHGWTLRGPGEFARFLAHLGGLTVKRSAGHDPVVIVGGGMAGVELAASIADRLRARRIEIPVTLVHSGDDVLPGLDARQPRLVAVARRELARLGVRTVPKVRVQRVDGSGVHLSDGSVLAASAVLATHGQRPVTIPGMDTLDRDGRGRLITDRTLRTTEDIWAAGDVARVAHPRTGDPVTANALWAIKAGTHVGRNVARVVRGARPRRFRYRGLGQAMSFGVGRSAAELYGVPICGWPGWLLRLCFFLRFMPRRRQALGVLAALALLPVRGRYQFDAAPNVARRVRISNGRSDSDIALPAVRATPATGLSSRSTSQQPVAPRGPASTVTVPDARPPRAS
jgi:NADH dehydrogenase